MKLTKLTTTFTPEGWDEKEETWDVELREEPVEMFVYDIHPKYETIFKSELTCNIGKLVKHVYGYTMYEASIWCYPEDIETYKEELKEEIRSIIAVKKILIDDMYQRSRENYIEINSPSDITL